MPTFTVVTLGCKVNQYESEQIASLLRARGWAQVEDADTADLRVVNTCSVTMQAAGKSRQTVRRMTRGKSLPLPVLSATPASASPPAAACVSEDRPAVNGETKSGPADHETSPITSPRSPDADQLLKLTARGRVIVTGCWATSNATEAAALPGVNAVLGHHDDVARDLTAQLNSWEQEDAALTNCHASLHAHASPLNDSPSNDSPSNDSPNPRAPGTTTLPQLDARHTGHQRAFLKVQDGCDAHCTYCIIPSLRPSLWSKSPSDAVEEAKRLVDAGHAEIVLTGIFLGAYGQPTALRRRQQESSGRPLGGLIEALCTRVPGLRRVRLSSLEPGDLGPELIAVLKSHAQIVPHFHLPLQSGSDLLLRKMNRQYTQTDFLQMVDSVHAAFDRPAITTDIIVGFPGETDAEFAQTLDVAQRVRFIHTHAFSYSPRPQTAAARWTKDFIRGPVVNQRIATLRDLAHDYSYHFRQQFVGETVEVLVEHPCNEECDTQPLSGHQHGRCERYFPVHFPTPRPRTGEALRVKITHVTPRRSVGTIE